MLPVRKNLFVFYLEDLDLERVGIFALILFERQVLLEDWFDVDIVPSLRPGASANIIEPGGYFILNGVKSNGMAGTWFVININNVTLRKKNYYVIYSSYYHCFFFDINIFSMINVTICWSTSPIHVQTCAG